MDTHSSPALRRGLVTGAAGGIGRAGAAALAAGRELVLTARAEEDLAAARRDFPDARLVQADLADTGAVAERFAGVEVDAVVHCAGIEGVAPAAELEPARLAAVLAVNLAAPVELTRVLLPGLRRRRGHVVLLNSTAALGTYPGWAAYAASQAGLRAYADPVRLEGPAVRVTSVFPGRPDTGMQHRIHAEAGRDFDRRTAMDPASVATAVRSVLLAPDDVEIPELVVNPFTHRGG